MTDFSHLMDLRPFFEDADDYVVLRLPDHFPKYRDHSDLDILCRSRWSFLRHILRHAKPCQDRGFKIQVRVEHGHWHVDFYAPGAEQLNFRFDLLESLVDFEKFSLSPVFEKGVLDCRREIVQNGGRVLVPRLTDDLAIRCLEFLAWRDVRPEKIAHWRYLEQAGNWDFIEVVNRHTNLNISVKRRWFRPPVLRSARKPGGRQPQVPVNQEPFHRPSPVCQSAGVAVEDFLAQNSEGFVARPRLDYFLIWGHGTQHTREILEIIRRQKAVQILAIHKKTVADIAKFVGQIYSSDFVPLEHLAAKTRYLLDTPSEVVLILARNLEPQERFFGEGAFRHIQCQRIKAIKEEIRDRFNPRRDGKRTEDHVVHASDFESQTEHVLEILGLPPVAYFTRRPNRELDVPYHLPPFENYVLKEVPVDSLYANILGRGVVPISQTPHYRYLLGEQAAYRAYHAAHFGRELTDDHLPETFDRLIASFDSNRFLEHGNKSYIVAVQRPGQEYQILDGVHRAALLKQHDVKSVLIVEPLYGEAPRSPQNGGGGCAEKSFKPAALIFSKDRPLQLNGALRSWKRHCRDAGTIPVKVLYKASTSRMMSLYRRLMQEHPEADFVQEGNFRRDLLMLLRGRDCVLFAVDDTVFVQDFAVADLAGTLQSHPDALGFSLRLGRNTTQCYSMNHAQPLPEFESLPGGTLKYSWPGAQYDFGYPLELSSSLYRIKDLLPLLEQLAFTNPNTLEEALSAHAGRFLESHPFLLCQGHSLAFSIPANRVQQVCHNRAGGNPAYSAETLAALFAGGQRIEMEAFDGFVPAACHQEAEFKTGPGAPPVPLISVVIPCYNQARYLPEAVASVAAQTLTDWEIIIVNDGSPDDTSRVARELMERYAGRRIRLLEKKNGGLARARNAGIRAAAGAYILPLDADDKIKPAMLEKTAALLEGEPGVAVAYTDVAHFGAAEKTVQAAEFDFKEICANNQLNCCSLFRREAWELAGGYNPNLVWGYEDWDFWIGCGEQGLVARRIPGPLLQYRVKDSSMLTEALPRDPALRARIVLNHPALYDAKKRLEARAICSDSALPAPPGAPKVSVIVPTFNRPERLEETLRSIIGQTMRDLEILVVNDNGLDVEHVIRRCNAEVEIVYLRHRVNQGLAAARNTGLRHASGRYIAFLDDDDIFLPDHLETLVSFLEGSGNKAAYTDAWCAEEEKAADGNYQIVRRHVAYSDDWDSEGILRQNSVPVLCFLHERGLGIATGEFDEQLATHEDWDYWIRLSRLCTPVHIKKVTCEFRARHDGTSMTSALQADFLRSTRLIYKKHAAHAAGNRTTRQRQKRILRKLERQLGRPRKNWFGARFAAALGRVFRRHQPRPASPSGVP